MILKIKNTPKGLEVGSCLFGSKCSGVGELYGILKDKFLVTGNAFGYDRQESILLVADEIKLDPWLAVKECVRLIDGDTKNVLPETVDSFGTIRNYHLSGEYTDYKDCKMFIEYYVKNFPETFELITE